MSKNKARTQEYCVIFNLFFTLLPYAVLAATLTVSGI